MVDCAYTSCKCSVNPVTNPNPICGHSYECQLVAEVVGLETSLDSHAINVTTGVTNGWIELIVIVLKTAAVLLSYHKTGRNDRTMAKMKTEMKPTKMKCGPIRKNEYHSRGDESIVGSIVP
jgi:hypothetical protein